MGYRCLAVDGTKLNIPNEPNDSESYVKSSLKGRGYNLLHLNALYDVNSKLYVVQLKKQYNKAGAPVEMLKQSLLGGLTILIADRGYGSYNAFAHLRKRGRTMRFELKDTFFYPISFRVVD